MKKLLLLRHAKSSWADASLPDAERPLNARGERAAGVVGVWLAQARLVPDLVLCSPAVRTRETLRRILPALPAEPLVRVEAALYGATPDAILGLLADVEDAFGSVLVLGHNPGLEDTARELAGDGEPGALDRLAAGLPTAGLAELDLPLARWRDLAPGAGRLARLVRPKELL